MDIAFNTCFLESTGSAEPYLKFISEAGFTHIHWSHHWYTDYLYSKYEIAEIAKWLKIYNLQLLDIHGSTGIDRLWVAPEEYRRKSGVELVLNRARMFAELEGQGGLIMHIPNYNCNMTADERKTIPPKVEALKRSLDELLPELEKLNVAIAVENGHSDTFETIYDIMDSYDAKYLGITFDSGHANIKEAAGFDLIEKVKDRIYVLHLNDNNNSGDQHQPPMYGTVDWDRVIKMLAGSSYAKTAKPLSFELVMQNTPFYTPEFDIEQPVEKIREFLADAYKRCTKIIEKYNDYR